MNTKEYATMKKLGEKILKDEATAEEAAQYVLLMEKSDADKILKKCSEMLRKDAAEKKKEYANTLGTVVVSEPYVLAVNEQEFMTEQPAKYQAIWNKKAAKIKLAVADLDKDDVEKYTHYVKSTAKVSVRLA